MPLRVSCPGPLLRLACLGGGGPVPVPPYLAWGCGGGGRASPGGCLPLLRGASGSGAPPPPTARPLGGLLGSAIHVLWARACGCGGPTLCPWSARPVGAACRGAGPWRSCAGGRAGGGGGRAPCPPFVRPGGACRAGGRSASFRPSAFPGQATKRVSLASFCPWGAWPPIPLRLVLARLHWARSVPRPGALARARLFSAGGRLGRGGGPRSGPSLGRGEGGPSPLPRGVGAGAPAACGPVGGVWGGGGVAPRPPCSPSGWRPAVPHPGPPRAVGALPSGVRVRSGSRSRPGVGGDEGWPVDRSPGGPCRPEPPLCPP